MARRGQEERVAVVESLDAAQRYGVDADLEAIADRLLGERAISGPERIDGQNVGEYAPEGDEDEDGNVLDYVYLHTLYEPTLYAGAGTLSALLRHVCGHCGEVHSPAYSVPDMMSEQPFGITRAPEHRFSWVPWNSRTSGSGRSVITTLGTPRMMRLVLLAESGKPLDGLHGLRARVNAYMGSPDANADKRTRKARRQAAETRKARGMRARPTIKAAANPAEGLPVDVERMERLANALAVGSGSWADRVA